MAPIRIVEGNSGASVPTFYVNTPNYLSEDRARVKQQPPMHQLRMKPFKPFWG